jgi:hypothetical protein
MKIIGPTLFAKNPNGQYVSSVGTLFPRHDLLITAPPMHALQREAFKDWFREAQAEAGQPAPTESKLAWEAAESVDLIFTAGLVLIRPELERLDLAFAADQQFQVALEVPRHRIRFLSVRDPRVRQALRERGELWRMSAPPSDHEEISQTIAHSRVEIGERAIYYYNPHTGTRFVTFTAFARLADLEDKALAAQLDEIGRHCVQRNRHGHPEVAFFGVDSLKFGGPNFMGVEFSQLASADLHSRHAALAQKFFEATPPNLREDQPQSRAWQQWMFAAIAGEEREELVAEALQGLSSEFSPRIRWLPGGRFEEGEFIFAPVFPKEGGVPEDRELKQLWDPLARGFIVNFIREYGNIEYLNLGRIEASPSAPALRRGRRGVYLAEIKVRSEVNARVLFLRVQRWGIGERLEEDDEHGNPKDLGPRLQSDLERSAAHPTPVRFE